jgi:hypothetical protein
MDGSSWLKGAIMFKAGRQPAQSNRFIPANEIIGFKRRKKAKALSRIR